MPYSIKIFKITEKAVNSDIMVILCFFFLEKLLFFIFLKKNFMFFFHSFSLPSNI